MAFLSREIAEGREVERIVVIYLPRDLARVKRGLDLAFDLAMESLCQIVIGAELRINCRKESQTVLDDRAADIRTRIKL